MKVIFNSRHKHSPATIFYRSGFEKNPEFDFSHYDRYDNYDVALFMGFKEDLHDLKKAKEKKPSILTGVLDPRGDHVQEYLPWIDFFIVDSIEMIDFFSKYQRPIFRYYEYFDVETRLKNHEQGDPIVIGYHGNKIHLMNMFPLVTDALDQLSKKYSIEFWAMYNKESLGIWDLGIPKSVELKHVQFDESNYTDIIDRMDIGIVPANVPNYRETRVKKSTLAHRKVLNHETQDYCLRFKMPTNPGRLIIFAKRGIPVVSDMFPSACEMIQHGVSGYLAHNTGGWYRSLEELIVSADKRQAVASSLYESIKDKVEYPEQNKKLLRFLKDLQVKNQPEEKTMVLSNSNEKISWFSLFLILISNYYKAFKKKLSNESL